MRALLRRGIAIGVLASATVPLARAEDFYRGKTVQVYVGFAPGGGYDAYPELVE